MLPIKSLGKKLLRQVGVEAHSYIPGSSQEAQMAAAMGHHDVRFVIDVGANEGQFGLELIESGFEGPILSVEPLPQAHARLARLAAKHANWTAAAPCALGAEIGNVEFHVAENLASSSILKVAATSVDAVPASRHIKSTPEFRFHLVIVSEFL